MQLWDWLGEPLPLDVANTVRRRGATYQELWRTWADVAAWAAHQTARLSALTGGDESRLPDLREVRDDVFTLLHAVADHRPYPADAATRINTRARTHPVIPQLGRQPGATSATLLAATSPVDDLLAHIVHATIEFTGSTDADRLALCDAPSCGQFFLRDRINQQWCGPACGTRARVARHARRS